MAKCRNCLGEVTWSEQRKQFARLLKRLPMAEAKPLLPRCQKCVTEIVKRLG